MPDFGLDKALLQKLALITGNFIGDTDTQTVTNKDMDYRNNDFENIRALYHIREWGLVNVNQNGGMAGVGFLAGFANSGGTGTVVNDSNGHYNTYSLITSGTTSVSFFTSAVTTRALNPRFRGSCGCAAADTTARYYVALSTVAPNSTLDTVMANTTSGVVIGARSTDTNIQVFNNDGSGAMVVFDTGIAKGSTNLKHFEIIASDSAPNFKCYIDGVLQATLTTRIPSTSAALSVEVVVAASTTTTITGKFQFAEIEHFGTFTGNWATGLPYAS